LAGGPEINSSGLAPSKFEATRDELRVTVIVKNGVTGETLIFKARR
jgi:hypothetical protein